MESISNKTVFITGASSGIGRACAEIFAKAGANLILAARREERLLELAEQLTGANNIEVQTIKLDVRDQSAVDQAVEKIKEPIDVLVNNAGLAAGIAKLQEADLENWERMIDTNVKGLLYVSCRVVPKMIARGTGHVINIGSVAGREAYSGGSVYCGTKFAVSAISRALKMDVLGSGVRVSCVEPGLVETEFSLVRFAGDSERAAAVYENLQPLAAEDVADAVFYCATRPQHVNVSEILLLANDQASATMVHRDK